ncbi:MAG: DUF7695 domain-containing protein [Lachnospiraceae bacterium]|jgi:hypothetical protein
MKKIKRNAIRCNHCGDVIESRNSHDFVTCTCGTCAVDGGLDYLRRMGNDGDFEELAEYEEKN